MISNLKRGGGREIWEKVTSFLGGDDRGHGGGRGQKTGKSGDVLYGWPQCPNFKFLVIEMSFIFTFVICYCYFIKTISE